MVANNTDEEPRYEKREIVSIKGHTISQDETKAFTPSYQPVQRTSDDESIEQFTEKRGI